MQQRDKPLQDWIRPLAGRTSHPPIPATGFLDVDNRSGIMVSQVSRRLGKQSASGANVNIDAAFKKAQAIWAEIQPNLEQIETEEDARFAIINRCLTEVLGWAHADVKNEPHTDSGYIDYLLSANGERVFVVEAKRTGKLLLDTVSRDSNIPKRCMQKISSHFLLFR